MAKDYKVTADQIILVDQNGNEYEIEFERCNDAGKILGWIYHLAGKSWVTPRHIKFFITTAADNAGIEVDHDA